MSTRWLVVLGLLAGLVVGAVAWAGVVALSPTPLPSATPLPSLALPTPPPTPSASPSVSSIAPSIGASPSASPSGSASTLFGIGKPAPPLTVDRLGGGTIDLASLHGKPVWVYFMATWCPSCRDDLPQIEALAARYGPNGLVAVAIDVREDAATVAGLVDGLHLTLPVGLDTEGTAQAAWRAAALPVHYWIDASGTVRYGAIGAIGPDVMVTGLRSVLPGVTVTP